MTGNTDETAEASKLRNSKSGGCAANLRLLMRTTSPKPDMRSNTGTNPKETSQLCCVSITENSPYTRGGKYV